MNLVLPQRGIQLQGLCMPVLPGDKVGGQMKGFWVIEPKLPKRICLP